jgi:hypothetical protein
MAKACYRPPGDADRAGDDVLLPPRDHQQYLAKNAFGYPTRWGHLRGTSDVRDGTVPGRATSWRAAHSGRRGVEPVRGSRSATSDLGYVVVHRQADPITTPRPIGSTIQS